jgi:hypothetical protein
MTFEAQREHRKKMTYQHIRAWGQMMGSNSEYIHDQIEQAKKDHAPHDATYFGDGRWHTFAEVTSIVTRNIIERSLKRDGES